MPKPWSNRLREVLVIIIGLPVVGLLMGGVYSFPAMTISRGRDPWLTLLLAGALAVTVFGVGIPLGGSPHHLLVVLAIALMVLGLGRVIWSYDHSAERFGMVHTLTLTILAVVLMVDRKLRR